MMARGNHVDTVLYKKKFGLFVLFPESKHQSFRYYNRVYISKGGILVGKWSIYRDYLSQGWPNYEVLRKTDNYIFLKPPTKNN